MPDIERSLALQKLVATRLDQAVARINGIANRWSRAQIGNRSARIEISLQGWSPSLHGIRIAQTVHIDSVDDDGTPIGVERIADTIQPMIDAIAARQRQRAEDAARLEHQKPLDKKAISHLYIDTALPALRDEEASACRAWLNEAIRRTHADSASHDGSAVYQAGGATIVERQDENGHWMRIILPQIKISLAEGATGWKFAKMRGFDLDLACPPLPETLVTALVGRPLSALTPVHPAIDHRIIRAATCIAGKTTDRDKIIVSLEIEIDPVDTVLPPASKAVAP